MYQYGYCPACGIVRRHYLTRSGPRCGYCTGHKEKPVQLLERYNWSGALCVATVVITALYWAMPW